MPRPYSRLTKQLLTLLVAAGHEVEASSRYWGKIGLARMIQDVSRALGDSIERARVQRTLQQLRARGWVAGEQHRIELTPEGRAAAKRVSLEYLQLKKPAVWDGVWRLVIWDIPESRRGLRNGVRRILARLGFIRIQRSVWVSPLPCEEEISAVREELGLQQGILYIEARRIEGERLLRKHFKLT